MLIVAYILLAVYFGCLLLLSLFSFHRYLMLYYYFKHRPSYRIMPRENRPLQRVTIQLPMYNERHVIDRLLDSVSRISYPKDHLQVQILDDSTDETQEIALAWAARLQREGFVVEYIHRDDRTGFKAGALEHGMKTATGDFIAIFDADFVAPPDFLQSVLGYFENSKIGMVQMRWEHLNRNFSLLTELQSIMIDGHFVIEHAARNRSGRFFNFNGTAGVWRKEAIVDAGGWQHDTLTEDLDLSYRAQLRGWQFVYVPAISSAAELPVEINAFKTQQHRWTKGSVQTALKLLPKIWRSAYPLGIKIEATFHLANNFAYLLMMIVALLMFPVLLVRERGTINIPMWIDLILFISATASIGSFYLASQREVLGNWRRQFRYIPMMMSLGIGLCVNNAKAVLEALFGMHTEFVRTPKYGIQSRTEKWWKSDYLSKATGVAAVEIALTIYYLMIIWHCLVTGNIITLPFMLLFLFGFGYVGFLSLAPLFQRSGVMERLQTPKDEQKLLLRS